MGRRGPENPAWLANPAVVVERRRADGRLERVETTAAIAEGDERARGCGSRARDENRS
ncbi:MULTISPECIES: hypothetical protein [Amycolatopsis]|uniref:hypothetical protein n=1 Tax=Amycolatopsis TaxID=1813 RepID=UPI0015A6C623|nr:hypothetical protein [Amycolatopsis sacchari]